MVPNLWGRFRDCDLSNANDHHQCVIGGRRTLTGCHDTRWQHFLTLFRLLLKVGEQTVEPTKQVVIRDSGR